MKLINKYLDKYNIEMQLNKDFTELKSFLCVLDEINPLIEPEFLQLLNSDKGLFISTSIIYYVQANYPAEYEEACQRWTVKRYQNEINQKTNAVAQ